MLELVVEELLVQCLSRLSWVLVELLLPLLPAPSRGLTYLNHL